MKLFALTLAAALTLPLAAKAEDCEAVGREWHKLTEDMMSSQAGLEFLTDRESDVDLQISMKAKAGSNPFDQQIRLAAQEKKDAQKALKALLKGNETTLNEDQQDAQSRVQNAEDRLKELHLLQQEAAKRSLGELRAMKAAVAQQTRSLEADLQKEKDRFQEVSKILEDCKK